MKGYKDVNYWCYYYDVIIITGIDLGSFEKRVYELRINNFSLYHCLCKIAIQFVCIHLYRVYI